MRSSREVEGRRGKETWMMVTELEPAAQWRGLPKALSSIDIISPSEGSEKGRENEMRREKGECWESTILLLFVVLVLYWVCKK